MYPKRKKNSNGSVSPSWVMSMSIWAHFLFDIIFIPFLHFPISLVLMDGVFKQLHLVLVRRCIYTVQTYVQLFGWNSTFNKSHSCSYLGIEFEIQVAYPCRKQNFGVCSQCGYDGDVKLSLAFTV